MKIIFKTFIISAICFAVCNAGDSHHDSSAVGEHPAASPVEGSAISEDVNFKDKIAGLPIQIRVSNPHLKVMHNASTLLVSCVDFRLRDETSRLMEEYFQLTDNYDEVVLPGASLALVQHEYKGWSDALEHFIEVVSKLHHIKRVVFLDHLGCGAYKMLIGNEHVSTEADEEKVHREVLGVAAAIVKEKFPELEVYALLMGLDGVIKNCDVKSKSDR